MKIGQMVTLRKGTMVGMVALRYDTDGIITHKEINMEQQEIYRVEFIDIKGQTKSTWIIAQS